MGPGWAHELKHDGYRLQIHVQDGRVRLYTMNGADWSKRYPLIIAEAARLKGFAILDAEVVCSDKDGVPDFGLLHSRCFDHAAVACAFDLLMLNGDDMRRKPFVERKAALGKLLFRSRDGIQYVEHAEVMATGCLPPPVTSGLRASFQKGWTPPIDRESRKRGSRSRIRTHPPQLALKTVRSEHRHGWIKK